MTDRHLDEGIIQAYIDGELSQEHAAATAAHLAACEACSAALASAEDESSFFATAFAPDESVSVPTAALRARLNAAVAQLEASSESRPQHSQGRSLGGFLASFSGLFTFTPRAATAFATLLVAVAAGIIYFASQRSPQTPARPGQGNEVARGTQAPTPAPASIAVRPPDVPAPVAGPEPSKVEKVNQVVAYKPRAAKRRVEETRAPKAEELPGEKEYQTAIASLEKTIKVGGEESLRPALRADYERNLALIDSAITQTRQVAAQNPKDKDAVGFLMAAYQSKVELLTRVADQTQLAALGR
ncbi:MAG TPA: zf-HC2 domain-containing protein [Pyrinomonadaceae bacterium]|nr:zf-HC2 domain-containing protein [Pyrinomonadaceae bacterium]